MGMLMGHKGKERWRRRGLAREVAGVERDRLTPLAWHRAQLEDGFHRAGWLTGAAIDALIWIDVVLVVFLAGVDAVDWAHVHTGCVLNADAGLADDIGHARVLFQKVSSDSSGTCTGSDELDMVDLVLEQG